MKLTINGKKITMEGGLSVDALLDKLNVPKKTIVVELGGKIIPREDHETTRLAEGDKLELIRFVGGG